MISVPALLLTGLDQAAIVLSLVFARMVVRGTTIRGAEGPGWLPDGLYPYDEGTERMSSDPGNLPFQRVMPDSRGHAHPDSEEAGPARADTLHAESIVLQEFNRANVTAYQLKEERTRTFNAALVQAGIVISALTALESPSTFSTL